jgi:hypothetical protein
LQKRNTELEGIAVEMKPREKGNLKNENKAEPQGDWG